MRIALTITELDPGGAEACLVNLAIYLAEKGHEVEVFGIGDAPRIDRSKLTHRLDQAGIPWCCGGFSKPTSFFTAVSWLRQRLQRFTPDIVQSMLFHANVISAVATKNLSCQLVGGVRVRQPQRIRWWLQRLASGRMEKLVCVSDDVLQHCKEREGIASSKLQVISNGVNLPNLRAPATADWRELGLPHACHVILFVGRLDRQKGVVPLMQEADRVLGPHPDYHLVFLGDGPQQEQLLEIRQRLQCADRIHLVGWHADPIDWMRASQILVLPAEYEGMPNVVLENMSAARPVVSYQVDGVRQLLGAGEFADAQLVESGNIGAFCDAIDKLIANDNLRRDCGNFNRRRIEEHFQLKKQLAKYELLYLGLSKTD